jgi:hypothetical protein
MGQVSESESGSGYVVLGLSPEVQRQGFLSDLADKVQARRDARTRAADLLYDQQERATLAMLGRAPATATQAIEAMVADDVDDDHLRQRAHNLVDRALSEGMEFREIKARLALEPPGLRSQKLQMERQQRERADAQAARQVQGSELDELRREVDRLRRDLYMQGRSATRSEGAPFPNSYR